MYVYSATRTREQAGASSLHEFTARIFDGDPLRLFQHLIEDERLTDDDLKALRKLIDQRRKESRDG